MADQKITELPIKGTSSINLADYLLGIDSAEGYQMLISDLAKKIIEDYSGSTVAGSAQALKTALDGINTKIGSATMGTTATTLTGAIAEHEGDIVDLRSDLAPVETANVATRAYTAGSYLVIGGTLYKATTAIASGATLTVGTNIALVTVSSEISNDTLYFTSVAVSATTGDIALISDARITADHVVTEVTWADPSAISSAVTWTTSAGSLVLNGTCASATTVNITLARKAN